ncbi:MAG: prepilin peptidase [Clostridia bacterium]|nr:prepilin peptidase [Clostridia bacterium]
MIYFMGAFVFIFGLFIGSFLNVCIYRIPKKKSIVSPPSTCPECGTRIKWYDLFPVLSFLILKGKCRSCKVKISPRYMMVELLTGLLFLACFALFGLSGQFLAYIVFTGILITITFTDIDEMIIPDSIMIFGVITGILFVVLGFVPEAGASIKESLLAGLFGMLAGAGPLIIINLLTLLFIKKAGVGGGDMKLMGVAGIYLGATKVLFALVLGVVIAGIFSVISLKNKKKNDDEAKSGTLKLHEIPFGPYLAVACFVSMLYGKQIVDWYLSFY